MLALSSVPITDNALLATLRPTNRRTHEHAGPCPFCGGGHGADRFRVWLTPERERYWCRRCDAKGWLRDLHNADHPRLPLASAPAKRRAQKGPLANPAHVAFYRQLYGAVALWAMANLWDPCNPEPLAYVRGRGLSDDLIQAAVLGYMRHDPASLPAYLRQTCPEALPYAEAAGVLVHWDGVLRAHPNLCGRILLPYLAQGEVADLRTRAFPGKGYASLAGGYQERGATTLFNWDALEQADTVLLTEGEFKALAVTDAYRDGRLSTPALAHPGLSYWRQEWAAQLVAEGVRTVVLAYDSQPRPVNEGQCQLAPEEIWSIRHGHHMRAAGLDVRVLRLPLHGDALKADLDDYLLQHGSRALERLITSAPSLADYHASLPRGLARAAKLPLHDAYPRHRARPCRRPVADIPAVAITPRAGQEPTETTIGANLAAIRAQIPQLVQDHVTTQQGFLVLAHPPGAGKGHGTVVGLRAYLQDHPNPGRIVWSALRANQIADQQGLDLIPLHGRNASNCAKFAEAQVLASKGYGVRESLCERRCPYRNGCAYVRQFGQDADAFAAQPLLLATAWWETAAVVVLDEFDPARLCQIVTLNTTDLLAMHRASACSHAQAILRWLSASIGTSLDTTLRGSTLLNTLQRAAEAEQLHFGDSLHAALAALPSDEDRARLPGLAKGATLNDYQALPPGYLPTLLRQLATELRLQLAGRVFTSRIEIDAGRLYLLLRHEHLLAQLAHPEQPKLVLDATVSEPLLRALFPDTPLVIDRPTLPISTHVRQALRADWAKSTLRGQRWNDWCEAVAQEIDPLRPTLVVCTLECVDGLRAALAQRNLHQATVAHYGALRGSNSYKGFDVLLAQVYHPNLNAVLREGRALFAGQGDPLDEHMITVERILTNSEGQQWTIQVPTFADARLAGLLEQRREAEMLQAALRGRPLDHPEARITLLCSLPLPGLTPTEVVEPVPTAASNSGRQAQAVLTMIAVGQQLIAAGQQRISVFDMAAAAHIGEVTVRQHWKVVANALGCEATEEIVYTPKRPRGYRRAVLVAPSAQTTDQADDQEIITSMIRTIAPAQPHRSRPLALKIVSGRPRWRFTNRRHRVPLPPKPIASEPPLCRRIQ